MARVKLSEYKAKSLFNDHYSGVSIALATLQDDIQRLQKGTTYIVKVDQGVKKRGKQGLLRLNVKTPDVAKMVRELSKKGYERFIAEPMLLHDDDEERYLSIERTRDGYKFLYSPKGGIEVEDHTDKIKQYSSIDKIPLPKDFLQRLLSVMDKEHMSFVEINPLVVKDDTCHLLDAAVMCDSAGEWESSWSEEDVVDARKLGNAELAVSQLNHNSPASFSFRVLNPDGAIWLLLSGGGASITIADEAYNKGHSDLIGNYGEYSGGPTTEETYLYTKYVLEQMSSSSSKRKAIVIAGGVANFTDVKKTFTGVIQALEEYINQNGTKGLKVFVRRGGPNERQGLESMRNFLGENGILGSVHGSDIVLTKVIEEAIKYVKA